MDILDIVHWTGGFLLRRSIHIQWTGSVYANAHDRDFQNSHPMGAHGEYEQFHDGNTDHLYLQAAQGLLDYYNRWPHKHIHLMHDSRVSITDSFDPMLQEVLD